MSKLFIALDATGAMRFIGEVDRGVGCGCVCPACGSPLVARQGTAYDWHFAHGASQERPECGAGGLGLLRRLAVEHLQAPGPADGASLHALPVYRQDVVFTGTLVHLREEVQWGARMLDEPEWLAEEEGSSLVARARLDTGVPLLLHVQIGEAGPVQPAPVVDEADAAHLVFRCRMPPASALRERRLALQYLQAQGELVWEHHPDTLGIVAAAWERLEARGQKIYGNWLAMVDAQRQSLADAAAPAAPLFYGPGSSAGPEAARRFACAPAHALNINFTFYRLSDEEAWLLYLLERVGPSDWRTAQQKFYALAPFPGPFEGWMDAVPRAIGTPDEALGAVRLTGFLDAVTYLSRRARTTRSARDPGDFEGL